MTWGDHICLVNPARAGMIPIARFRVNEKASKPRASGDDPEEQMGEVMVVEVNPARAGMILLLVQGRHVTRRKPRASGDDPSDTPRPNFSFP